MIYFDSAYIAKCYLPERGHREVLALAEVEDDIVSSQLARVEVAAVLHRKLGERELAPADFREVFAQFDDDCAAGLWRFIPLDAELVEQASAALRKLPASVYLRSADCMHLITARSLGCEAIYTNDRHVLAAASRFGLRGIDVISA